MGGRRRSSSNKPVPKKRPKLDKIFKCPKCSHDGSTVQITKKEKEMEAVISCKVCKSSHKYRKRVTYLTEPIDVFSDWIDAIDQKGKHTKPQQGAKRPSTSMKTSTGESLRKAHKNEEYEDEIGDDVLNTPGLRRKPFSGNEDEEIEEELGDNAEPEEEDDDEEEEEDGEED